MKKVLLLLFVALNSVSLFPSAASPSGGSDPKKVSESNTKSTQAQAVCPICMDELTDGQQAHFLATGTGRCGHVVCQACIKSFIADQEPKTVRRCPLCRQQFDRVMDAQSTIVWIVEPAAAERPVVRPVIPMVVMHQLPVAPDPWAEEIDMALRPY